jgi:hypothetical protein
MKEAAEQKITGRSVIENADPYIDEKLPAKTIQALIVSIESALNLSHQKEAGASAVWVKAAKRLPDKEGEYLFRVKGDGKNNSTAYYVIYTTKDDYNKLDWGSHLEREWLDESQSPPVAVEGAGVNEFEKSVTLLGDAHTMLARTKMDAAEYNPISALLAEAKVILFKILNSTGYGNSQPAGDGWNGLVAAEEKILSSYDKRGVRAFVKYQTESGKYGIEIYRKKTAKELQEEFEKFNTPIDGNWRLKRIGHVLSYESRVIAYKKAIDLAGEVCKEFKF